MQVAQCGDTCPEEVISKHSMWVGWSGGKTSDLAERNDGDMGGFRRCGRTGSSLVNQDDMKSHSVCLLLPMNLEYRDFAGQQPSLA